MCLNLTIKKSENKFKKSENERKTLYYNLTLHKFDLNRIISISDLSASIFLGEVKMVILLENRNYSSALLNNRSFSSALFLDNDKFYRDSSMKLPLKKTVKRDDSFQFSDLYILKTYYHVEKR